LFSLVPSPLPPLQRLRGIYKYISLPPVPEQATNARQYNNRAKEKKIKKEKKKSFVGSMMRVIVFVRSPAILEKKEIAISNVEVADSKY
jgi:hypothetical protein